MYKLLSEKDFEVRQIKKKHEDQARGNLVDIIIIICTFNIFSVIISAYVGCNFSIIKFVLVINTYFLAIVAGAVTNETAATKIVELSKKVRDLNAELESERTKARQYGKKCIDLQTQV